MIIDDMLEMADAVALNTGGAGTYLIGDQVDLTLTASDIGNGEPMYVVITVDTAGVSAGGGTINFKVVSDASAAIATDGTATEHATTNDFTAANLSAGRVIVIPLPSGFPDYERYLGILQVTTTAAFSAGKVNIFLTRDPSRWRAYPDASN